MKEVVKKANGVNVFLFESETTGIHIKATEDWSYTIGTEEGSVNLNNIGYALLVNAIYDYKMYEETYNFRHFGKELLELITKKANVSKDELLETFEEIGDDIDFEILTSEDLYEEIIWTGMNEATKC